MRNFRNVALATATAATLAITGTGVALADTPAPAATGTQADALFKGTKGENDKPLKDIIADGTKGVFNGQGSSQFLKPEDPETPKDTEKRFDARTLLGRETNWQEAPQWARLWVDGTLIAGIAAAIGGVIAAVNWASYNGWIQLPQLGR